MFAGGGRSLAPVTRSPSASPEARLGRWSWPRPRSCPLAPPITLGTPTRQPLPVLPRSDRPWRDSWRGSAAPREAPERPSGPDHPSRDRAPDPGRPLDRTHVLFYPARKRHSPGRLRAWAVQERPRVGHPSPPPLGCPPPSENAVPPRRSPPVPIPVSITRDPSIFDLSAPPGPRRRPRRPWRVPPQHPPTQPSPRILPHPTLGRREGGTMFGLVDLIPAAEPVRGPRVPRRRAPQRSHPPSSRARLAPAND